MEEKRMIGDYTVLSSIRIGHSEVALAENDNADKDEHYICCFVEGNLFFERYEEVLAGDDYAEIVKIYGERVAKIASVVMDEAERIKAEIGNDDEIKSDGCKVITSDDDLENKVIVIKGGSLRPEYRHASSQLYLCTGGFGAQPNARGRTCFVTSLYDGEETNFPRSSVLGVVEPDDLPEWAKCRYEKIIAECADERR